MQQPTDADSTFDDLLHRRIINACGLDDVESDNGRAAISPPDRLIVIAGTVAQARYFCAENRLNPHRDIVYVSGLHAIRGMPRGSQFVCVGTYTHRRDLREIFSYLDCLGAVRVLPEQRQGPDAWMLPTSGWTRTIPEPTCGLSDDAFSMQFANSSGEEPV